MCIIRLRGFRVSFACTKRLFNLSAGAIINVHNARLCVRWRNIRFGNTGNSFFMSVDQGFYIFEESLKSFEMFLVMSVVLASIVLTENNKNHLTVV